MRVRSTRPGRVNPAAGRGVHPWRLNPKIRSLIPSITVAGVALALTAGAPQAAADAISTSLGTDDAPSTQTRPLPAPLDVHTMRHPLPAPPVRRRHRRHVKPDIPASIM